MSFKRFLAMNHPPRLLALDFDGVVCDGMQEYFQASVRCYGQIWQDRTADELQILATDFYCLRPLIESGWEMPLLLRARILDIPVETIEANWSVICRDLLEKESLTSSTLAQTLDRVRDRWIQTDLVGWLGLHRFYTGVIERLTQLICDFFPFFIITTKEGRFVRQLLSNQGVAIAPERIIGKEAQRPKSETLRRLCQSEQLHPQEIWFVEDLPKTLYKIQKIPDLERIGLFLADWGYNTRQDRQAIAQTPSITLLSLKQFGQSFSQWQ
jgi:phosphoglycolate phosphatase-like HAD superfamily hydrolase